MTSIAPMAIDGSVNCLSRGKGRSAIDVKYNIQRVDHAKFELRDFDLAQGYRQSVVQSSTYLDSRFTTVAGNAVDGNTDQDLEGSSSCSHTAGSPLPAWWRIEFNGSVHIDRIIIYHRSDGSLFRFQHSSVHLSADCTSNTVYTQPDIDPPLVQTIEVDGVGKYVTVCNKMNILHMCEVLLMGCPYSKYGDQCNFLCGHCDGVWCSLSDGACPGECKDQYMGPKCDKTCSDGCTDSSCNKNGCTRGCVPGKHGDYCDQTCPPNCKNNLCRQSGGYCTKGCTVGHWGDDCQNECPANCNNSVCGQSDRKCTAGCVFGKHGDYCDQTCPPNCKNNLCRQSDGFCTEGCDVGHSGDNCQNECPANCKNSVCGQIDRKCTDGCVTGKHGDYCDQTCPPNCKNNICGQNDGFCTEGCAVGHCGDVCQNECPTNCKSSACGQSDRKCTAGCVLGKRGDYCDQPCPPNCKKNICGQSDGFCTEGCMAGYWTGTCQMNCSTNCIESICSILTGSCVKGCRDGYRGQDCNDEKEVDAIHEEPDMVVTGIGIGLGSGILGAVVALVTVYVCQCLRTGVSQRREVTELNTIAANDPNNYDTLGASQENENMYERIGAHEGGTKASCNHKNEEASRQNRTSDERS
ncbi:hypothetical protein ScPMuIL_000834 [Solemya velum]